MEADYNYPFGGGHGALEDPAVSMDTETDEDISPDLLSTGVVRGQIMLTNMETPLAVSEKKRLSERDEYDELAEEPPKKQCTIDDSFSQQVLENGYLKGSYIPQRPPPAEHGQYVPPEIEPDRRKLRATRQLVSSDEELKFSGVNNVNQSSVSIPHAPEANLSEPVPFPWRRVDPSSTGKRDEIMHGFP